MEQFNVVVLVRKELCALTSALNRSWPRRHRGSRAAPQMAPSDNGCPSIGMHASARLTWGQPFLLGGCRVLATSTHTEEFCTFANHKETAIFGAFLAFLRLCCCRLPSHRILGSGPPPALKSSSPSDSFIWSLGHTPPLSYYVIPSAHCCSRWLRRVPCRTSPSRS